MKRIIAPIKEPMTIPPTAPFDNRAWECIWVSVGACVFASLAAPVEPVEPVELVGVGVGVGMVRF